MKFKTLVAVLPFVLFLACKKSKKEEPIATDSRQQLTTDSLYKYAQQIYLWNASLPSFESFNARQYANGSSDLEKYKNVLYKITQVPIYPVTGKPYEYAGKDQNNRDYTFPKYSYIFDKTTANPEPTAFVPHAKSDVDLNGNGNDIGLKLGAYGISETTDAYFLFVTAVDPGSPAALAGLTRSDRIAKVNGKQIGVSFNAESDNLESAFNNATIKIDGVHYLNGIEGDAFSITLNKASYKSSPVYTAKVLSSGTKKLGYLAYARFSSPANSQTDLVNAFNDFSANGVTDLIIDLRYNGGGYVETATLLNNLIAPTSLNGQVMFTEYYNKTLTDRQATILKNQPLLDDDDHVQYTGNPRRLVNYFDDVDYSVAKNTAKFEKAGSLESVQNVVFIVSENTASAAELVINSLRPYLNVKLVGSKTFGKPVGFFPICLENKYDVYLASFQTKNKNGEGDYFLGMAPDVADDFDDPRYNFGDAHENYIAKAINLLNPSAVPPKKSTVNSTMSVNGKSISVKSLKKMKPIVGDNEFVGMIDKPHQKNK